MIKLLQFLWSGCWHKWEIKAEHSLSDDSGNRGTRINCRCEKCGKWTKFDLI